LNAIPSFGLWRCPSKIWTNFKEKKMSYEWSIDRQYDGITKYDDLNDGEILAMAEKYDFENQNDVLEFAREVLREFMELNQ
jgi:hypothetical protein